jgi:hypothetical protein
MSNVKTNIDIPMSDIFKYSKFEHIYGSGIVWG